MNVKELLKDGGLQKGQKVEFHEAHGCYDGTELHVRYLHMPKTVNDSDLVMLSNTVAAKLQQCEPKDKLAFVAGCQAVFVPANGTYTDFWRIQMSDSTKVVESFTFDF